MSKSKSELLNESIIDATELKRAAMKNAEQILLKTYGPAIERHVETLLEQGDKELIQGATDNLGAPPELPAEMSGDPGADGMDMGMEPPPEEEPKENAELPETTKRVVEKQPMAVEEPSQTGKTPHITVTLGSINKIPAETEEGTSMSTKPTIDVGEEEGENLEAEGDETLEENDKLLDDEAGEEDVLDLSVDDEEDEDEVDDELDLDRILGEEVEVDDDELLEEEDEVDDEEGDALLQEIEELLEEDIVNVDTSNANSGSFMKNKEELETATNNKKLQNKLAPGKNDKKDPNLVPSIEKVRNCKSDCTTGNGGMDHHIEISKGPGDKEVPLDVIKEITENAIKISLETAERHYNKKILALQEKNKSLLAETTIYKKKLGELRNALEKSSLLNTRLFYKNQILHDPSLNERQKDSIVEAISKAEGKEKVKTIYEIRQNFLGSNSSKKEKTLEQILESKNYLQTFRRKPDTSNEMDDVNEKVKSRMQILAGIKKDE